MRRLVLAVALVAGCGGEPAEPPEAGAPYEAALLDPTALTTVGWHVEAGAIVCPGASTREEYADGRVVTCQWACGAYDPAPPEVGPVERREIRLTVYVGWSYPTSSWEWILYSEHYDYPGVCLPTGG
jgi:hypothetical protein